MKKLIFIETDISFVKNIENNLEKENLSDEYSVIMIMPETSSKKIPDLVIKSCVEQVLDYEKNNNNIFGIFIDICIIDGESISLGIEIASLLRKHFPQLPIFNITNKTKIDSDFDALSSASLEDVDGVLVKSFLEDESFSKKRFDTIFLKAHAKRAITTSDDSDFIEKENQYDIAIITALIEPELKAVKKTVKNLKSVNKDSYAINDTTLYYEGDMIGKSKKMKVVLASDDRMGMPSITSLTTRIISSFKPKYIVVLGIGAGIEGNTNIGDIMVAEYSWDYGSGKLEEIDEKKIFHPYINQLKLKEELRSKFLKYKENSETLNKIREAYTPVDKSVLNIHIGPFASGAAVISSDMFVDKLKDDYKKLIGFDMEVYGVFCAAESFPDSIKPNVIAIKGVSDHGTMKKNNPLKTHHQAYAAYTSSEFFKEFVKNEL